MGGGAQLGVALITDVFHDPGGRRRLSRRLAEARELGAGLAVLPELPLDPWWPALRERGEGEAEEPGGPRQQMLAAAARESGVALLGGAIVIEPAGGERHSTALIYDARGEPCGAYRKIHLPEEPGYWESLHYEPGRDLPAVFRSFGVPLAVQLCSDVNRPELSHALGAGGAEAILVPRATPRETYERWKLVLRANAVTSGTYVLSVNRPRPERGADIGGPSLAIAPDGEVLLESEAPLSVVMLDRETVRAARREYPGYLAVYPGLYARAWSGVEREDD